MSDLGGFDVFGDASGLMQLKSDADGPLGVEKGLVGI